MAAQWYLGERLNGSKNYTVTFPKGQLPPVKGFWSLTLYNEHHFFHPNDLNRYSLGTKNKGLKPNDDGSLTLYVQTDPPEESKRSNWLPAPKADFSLYVRCYWPDAAITDGKWTPPGVVRRESAAFRSATELVFSAAVTGTRSVARNTSSNYVQRPLAGGSRICFLRFPPVFGGTSRAILKGTLAGARKP